MTHTAAFEADDLEPAAPEAGGRLREMVVQLSIVIVIVAFGVALRTTLGFGLAISVAMAIAGYWALLLVHALVRRGYDIADLSAEVADLADENAELRRLVERRSSRADDPSLSRLAVGGADRFGVPVGVTRGGATGPAKVPTRGPMKGDAPPTLVAPRSATAPPPARAPEAAERGGERSAARTGAGGPAATPASSQAKAPPPPKPTLGVPEPVAVPRPGSAPTSGRAASPPPAPPPLGTSGGMTGGERKTAPPPPPRGPKAPVAPAPVAAKPAPALRQPAADDAAEDEVVDPAVAAADPRAQDIAMMQSLIKGLADQLNGPAATSSPAAGRAPHDGAFDNVDGQVDALRQVASDMRAPPEPPVEAPASHRDQGVLARIAGAVDAARIDVYLDPILGLDDHRARHYEVSVVLRDDDGGLLDPREFARAIAGTGLAPLIDAHAVTESTRLAGQIAARGSNASLFSSLSGESIRDGGFHSALAGALSPDMTVASRLVMAVSQNEIRAFGPAHWEALAVMAESGLRYALVDVVDLDVDFEGLKRHGFDFVRLDAQVFLDGLPAPHGVVPSADLCRYLSQLGFSLIVGRITDERELVKVFGFGALLGQGRLFGAPRPIKVDRAARTSAA